MEKPSLPAAMPAIALAASAPALARMGPASWCPGLHLGRRDARGGGFGRGAGVGQGPFTVTDESAIFQQRGDELVPATFEDPRVVSRGTESNERCGRR